jgi:hypothetical protein
MNANAFDSAGIWAAFSLLWASCRFGGAGIALPIAKSGFYIWKKLYPMAF